MDCSQCCGGSSRSPALAEKFLIVDVQSSEPYQAGTRVNFLEMVCPWERRQIELQVQRNPADPVVPDTVPLGRSAPQHILEVGQGMQRGAVGHFVD
jgi:hypothetical protein